jgi:hypothetical protein
VKDGDRLEVAVPGFSLAEEPEAEAGNVFDFPGSGDVGFSGRGGLVQLSDAVEKGSGEGVRERQMVRSSEPVMECMLLSGQVRE